jgi:hypothetical protein
MERSPEDRVRPVFVALLSCAVAVIVILAWMLSRPASDVKDAPPSSEPNAEMPAAKTPARATTESRPSSIPAAGHMSATPVAVETRKGNGTITGKVKTSDGQPVSNAKVSAILRDSSVVMGSYRPYERKKKPTLDEAVAETIRNYRLNEANTRETVTDANGVYALTGLADANYSVEAGADGYAIEASSPGRAWQVHPNATLDFVAEVVIKVPIQVFLPNGTLASRATIMLEKRSIHGSSSMPSAWTSDDPNIPVQLGTFTLSAQGGDHNELRSESQKICFKKGEQPVALVFQLRTRPLIKGRIIPPDGAVANNSSFSVYLLKTPVGTTPDPVRLRREGNNTWVHSEAYQFDDISAGTYLIGAGYSNGKILVSASVTVTDGEVTQDLTIPALSADEVFVVWVRGPDGGLLADVDFGLERRYKHGSSSSGANTSRREDGAWLIMRSNDQDDSGGDDVKYIVTATTDEYGAKTAEFTGAEREKTIQFNAPATVKVTIPGYAGSANEGRLLLSLEKAKDADGHSSGRMFHNSRKISAEGIATLGPVEAGNYEIVLSSITDHRFGQGRTIARQPVQLQAGENTATMEMPTLYALTLSFKSNKPGDSVMLHDGSHNDMVNTTVDKDATVTFENLPAGKYKVETYGDKARAMYITLSGNLQTDFVVNQPDAGATQP